jgi:hypothetical protein
MARPAAPLVACAVRLTVLPVGVIATTVVFPAL